MADAGVSQPPDADELLNIIRHKIMMLESIYILLICIV